MILPFANSYILPLRVAIGKVIWRFVSWMIMYFVLFWTCGIGPFIFPLGYVWVVGKEWSLEWDGIIIICAIVWII